LDDPTRHAHARSSALPDRCAAARGEAHGADSPPDAPLPGYAPKSTSAAMPGSYDGALAAWRSPEDIARFAGSRFVYDLSRALALSEPASGESRPAIRTPRETFAQPNGVCLDLARFAVETLNRIDAAYDARYLMIEFEPVVVDGRTLRRHWIATFRRDGALWFFADSARPGEIVGPYSSVDAFAEEYRALRGRPIVAVRITDSYARKLRAPRTTKG
jgi:hypothetical protein